MSALFAAERLLDSGKFFTAIEIARIFGQSTMQGQRYINNITKNPRFEIEQKLNPQRIRVISIDGRKQSIDKLQNTTLLFSRPKLLSGK